MFFTRCVGAQFLNNPKKSKRKLEKSKPIGIDLFAGAGGLSLGFENAGFDIRYAIENDKHAAETYVENRKNNKDLIVDTRDIYSIGPEEILQKLGLKKGELDIVIGGPPCQGFSQSNMRTRNLANPQNQMVFKFIEFVNALKPKWFLMENVAGLSSLDNGKLKDLLIEEFEGMGYSTQSLILNAVNFEVPQSRNRIFFIGNRVGKDMTFTAKLANKKMKRPVTVKDAISDLPKLISGHDKSEMSYNKRKKTISSYQAKMKKGMNGKVENNLVSKNSKLVLDRYKHIKQGENLITLAKKKPELVNNYKKVENCHHWIYMRLSDNKPSVTLNNYRKNMLIHPAQNRGLSVREAARIQSFYDNYMFYGTIGFQQQQVANAVPPMLAKAVAGKILLAAFQ